MNLKQLRQDLGLTQLDIATTLNCTQTKISDIERQRRKLQLEDLGKLIKAYNITSDQIKELILNELKEKESD
ncbi:MAG: helix-turn-helix transcriptional regulator [Candidatus Muirbacterium halophilum]|nr:helix-turn-helix transcriptional regulator [Candidatus Muirbacterium halophilum]